MWDTEYKPRRAPEVKAPARKKLNIEIPDARKAMAAVDAALEAMPSMGPTGVTGPTGSTGPTGATSGNAARMIPPGPASSWTKAQVRARLEWLATHDFPSLLFFLISRCACVLEGDDG